MRPPSLPYRLEEPNTSPLYISCAWRCVRTLAEHAARIDQLNRSVDRRSPFSPTRSGDIPPYPRRTFRAYCTRKSNLWSSVGRVAAGRTHWPAPRHARPVLGIWGRRGRRRRRLGKGPAKRGAPVCVHAMHCSHAGYPVRAAAENRFVSRGRRPGNALRERFSGPGPRTAGPPAPGR